MSVYLAPADARLTDAIASEGWLDGEEGNQALGYGSGVEGAQKAYESLLGAFQDGSLYGVYRDKEPVAMVVLRPVGSDVMSFHGYVAPKYQGTILAARAIEAVERATLGNGTHRLETEVLLRNQRALRLLKGLGFRPEGDHKHRHLMDGKRENTVTLRMLQTEWKARQL